MKPKIFIDMDGVIVDFNKAWDESGLDVDTFIRTEGAFKNMKPMKNAIDSINKLIEMDYDVFIATKPPTGNAQAYFEKAQWVFDNLPLLTKKLIITPDKGLLGSFNDFLIDDRTFAANCKEFPGTLIEFNANTSWVQIVEFFRVYLQII